MLVIIKSAPKSDEARRGLRIAMDTSSDLVLLQDGVYFVKQGAMESFKGATYIVEDDLKLRGMGAEAEGVRRISYAELVDLMAGGRKVVGMF